MLTITDLSRNEELSASRMGAVVGGEDDVGCGSGSRSGAGPEGPDPGGAFIGGLLLVTASIAGAVMSCAPIISVL
jgi:hypothetical protein